MRDRSIDIAGLSAEEKRVLLSRLLMEQAAGQWRRYALAFGMMFIAAVSTALAFIMKAPSPQSETTGRSGAASLAPSAPATAKPIEANPQVCRNVRVFHASYSETSQL